MWHISFTDVSISFYLQQSRLEIEISESSMSNTQRVTSKCHPLLKLVQNMKMKLVQSSSIKKIGKFQILGTQHPTEGCVVTPRRPSRAGQSTQIHSCVSSLSPGMFRVCTMSFINVKGCTVLKGYLRITEEMKSQDRKKERIKLRGRERLGYMC